MDAGRKKTITSTGASPVHSYCPKPQVSPSDNHSSSSDSPGNLGFRHGSVIPNRIYVGGSGLKVSESELLLIFSQYGTVSGVNIVCNHYRLISWYAFVTFENPEDAQRLLLDVNRIYYKGQRLNIRQAICRQRNPRCLNYSSTSSVESVNLTTSSGFPYTFHNGVAYFLDPRTGLNPHQWTPQSAPVRVPQPYQPVYHQPVYHNYQSPMSSGPMMYAQPEYLQHVPAGVSTHQPPIDNSNESYMYSSFPVTLTSESRLVLQSWL